MLCDMPEDVSNSNSSLESCLCLVLPQQLAATAASALDFLAFMGMPCT
jgi:hypothetical protein